MSPQSPQGDKRGPFVSDIEEIRRRARQHIENGAVTDGYRADRETVIRVLNEALATEIVCVLRYKRHHYMAAGIHAQAVAEEFLEHANEEQQHADMIAERIVQLGGAPNFQSGRSCHAKPFAICGGHDFDGHDSRGSSGRADCY